jgi:predicted TIM-barrel fold metal-dependent hydrolase
MFGIDSPFHHPTVEIQKVMACGIDENGLENIFYNNAKAFMRL